MPNVDQTDVDQVNDSHRLDGSSRTVAVVLTYRRPRLASQSVRYLLDREGMDPQDVLVVVNGVGGLDDQTLADQIQVLRLDTNLGPAGGMRAGLVAATKDPTVDWIYLCEDDIGASELPGGRLGQMRDQLADRPADGPPVGAVVAYAREMDERTGLTTPHLPSDAETGLIPTDVASWGASLISRRVVDAGVLPDDTLFFGYEDFDFFLSIRDAGFQTLLDADCARMLGRSVHPSGREEALGHERPIDDAEPWRRYYEARNFMHLRRRHGDLRWTMTHLAKSLRRGSLGSWPHRKAIVTGLIDGLRGRTGRHEQYLRADDGDELPATIGEVADGSEERP